MYRPYHFQMYRAYQNEMYLYSVHLFPDADGVLVLDPGLHGRAAIVIPSVGGVLVPVLERQDDARNGATIDTEVGHVNLQHVSGLIVGVARVVGNLGVQDHVVFCLVVLELDGARSEVISCCVEHSRISKVLQARRPR